MPEIPRPIEERVDASLSEVALAERYINLVKLRSRQPQMEDFRDAPTYPADHQRLQQLETEIAHETTQHPEAAERSRLFEHILASREHDLFGEEVEAVPTSRFDDVVNGVDLVLEVKQPNSQVLRLGIDATVSQTPHHIAEKGRNIRDRLLENDLALRYFKSAVQPGTGGTFRNIPRVVIGLDPRGYRTFLEALQDQAEGIPALRESFLTAIKVQLENQFIYALGVNGYKMDTARGGERRPKLKDREEAMVALLYRRARDLAKGNWSEETLQKLFDYWERKHEIFDQVSFRDRRELLDTLKDLWRWADGSLTQIHQEETVRIKEKAASLQETTFSNVLTDHWLSDQFDWWPIFVRT